MAGRNILGSAKPAAIQLLIFSKKKKLWLRVQSLWGFWKCTIPVACIPSVVAVIIVLLIFIVPMDVELEYS